MKLCWSGRLYDLEFVTDGQAGTLRMRLGTRTWEAAGLAGWAPMALSAGVTGACAWTAREIVELPHSEEAELHVSSFARDAVAVFPMDDGWIVVDEMGVTLLGGRVVRAGWDGFSDVPTKVALQGYVLHVEDAKSIRYAFEIGRDAITLQAIADSGLAD